MRPTPKYFKQIILFLLLVIACIIPVVFIEPTVGLAQPESPLPEPNTIVVAYAEAMQIDYAEAERRLTLQHEMSLVVPVIAQDEAYFATWVQHEPSFGLVVSFTTADGNERIRKYLKDVQWADLVTVQQSDITREELADMRSKVVEEAKRTEIDFGSGLNYRTGQVRLYTEKTDELRERLKGNDKVAPIIERIEFVKESGVAPADYDYPYLLGGHALQSCTTGFPVYRTADSRRFISTAGHCSNAQNVQYNGVNAVYLGDVIWENDLEGVGPFGDDLDFQVHDAAGARAFDLTNRIKTGATATQSVVGTQTRNDTFNNYVCKYGRITGQTCGYVDDLNYIPNNPVYGGSDNYVRVFRIGNLGNMACLGDSGAPVYKYGGGGVYGLGVLSGTVDCAGPNASTHFFYSPVDYINWSPYRILTTHYTQYKYQTVWRSATDCTEYYRMMDENGNAVGPNVAQQCPNMDLPGSGTINSHTAYITGNQLRESMWRGNVGYTRLTPLNNNGTVNWPATGTGGWNYCCGGTVPQAQSAFVVGNQYNQKVYQSVSVCKLYSRPLNNAGNPSGTTTEIDCPGPNVVPPGSGAVIKTYSAFVLAGKLREELWIDNKGYIRNVPLAANNTAVNWNSPEAWTQCCTNNTPLSQDGYIVSRP